MNGSRLIQTLRIQNFLSFGPESEAVDLQPLNVLIGPNASGKSNLIEALGLLRAALLT
jgi:AAA15 family ATPase/GTPase